MIKKHIYSDIDSTARLPVLNLRNDDAESLNNTEILRFNLERLDGVGEWAPQRRHIDSSTGAEQFTALRHELALVQHALSQLQASYNSLEHQHARHEVSHRELQTRHELLIANQEELQVRLATATKAASRARAENSKNVKHIARLLKRINEQQAQLLSLKTSHE